MFFGILNWSRISTKGHPSNPNRGREVQLKKKHSASLTVNFGTSEDLENKEVPFVGMQLFLLIFGKLAILLEVYFT